MKIDTSIETTLVSWIATALPDMTAVILDRQSTGAVRPDLPYAVITINPPIHEGPPCLIYSGIDDYFLEFHKRFAVGVKIIAESGHLQYMEDLKNSLWKESVKMLFRASEIGFQTFPGPANDLTELLDTEFEFVVQQDFQFGYKETVDCDIVSIDRISGDVTVSLPDGTDITAEFDVRGDDYTEPE